MLMFKKIQLGSFRSFGLTTGMEKQYTSFEYEYLLLLNTGFVMTSFSGLYEMGGIFTFCDIPSGHPK